MTEPRRSPRVIACISVLLAVVGQDRAVRARAAVVNRHGALVLSPVRYAVGTLLQIQHESSLEAAVCRVTWVGEEDISEIHKLGVEFVDDTSTFWGAVYEERLASLEEDGP